MNPPLETKGEHPQEEEKKELTEGRREQGRLLIVRMKGIEKLRKEPHPCKEGKDGPQRFFLAR
jgi:hypothetical protein